MRFFLLVHSDSIKVRDPILTSMMCISADVIHHHIYICILIYIYIYIGKDPDFPGLFTQSTLYEKSSRNAI
jgi:hypothetical protein